MRKNPILAKVARNKKKFAPKPEEGAKVKEVRGRVYAMTDAHALNITAEVKDGSLVFTTKGRWISLNDIISKAHWISDTDVAKAVKKKVREAIRGIDLKLTKFRIVIRYNSKLDDHNVVMMPKYFTDAIKRNYEKYSSGKYVYKNQETKEKILEFEGIIEDDDKRYSRGTHLIPDETLPHNTYIMTYESV
jgi:hypothetical protein